MYSVVHVCVGWEVSCGGHRIALWSWFSHLYLGFSEQTQVAGLHGKYFHLLDSLASLEVYSY